MKWKLQSIIPSHWNEHSFALFTDSIKFSFFSFCETFSVIYDLEHNCVNLSMKYFQLVNWICSFFAEFSFSRQTIFVSRLAQIFSPFSALLNNLSWWTVKVSSPALPGPGPYSFHSIRPWLFSSVYFFFLIAIKGGKVVKENWKFPKTNMRAKERIDFFYLFAPCASRVEEKNW